MRLWGVIIGAVFGALMATPVLAACDPLSPVSGPVRGRATGLDKQTADNVRITGGCIDVPELYVSGVAVSGGAGGGGSGDVVGPASAVDNRVAAFDGATGKLIKDSGVLVTGLTLNADNLSGLTSASTARTNLGLSALATTTPGTGVATALGVAVGNAGAPVLFNGALGTPTSGTLTNATGLPIASLTGAGAGVLTFFATPSSANLASAVTGETGSGALAFGTGPTLTGVTLGDITGSAQCLHVNTSGVVSGTGSECGGTGTTPAGSSGDIQTNSAGVFGALTPAAGISTFLATPSSGNLAAAVTGDTGSGALVFANSPVLTTPNLGTPSAGTLTNTTDFPLANLAGAGTGVLTFLATPSSANLRAALTDETGPGAALFAGGALGTPTSGTLTFATGLPISTGLVGAGAGVLTALGVNVGSAGAPVLFNGAGGTPSSMDGVNITNIVNNSVRAAALGTGTSATLTAPRQYYVCTGTCTVTPPVPAAGYEFCVMNGNNVSTVITLAAIGSSARYENTARTAYGTAGTGTLVSTGATGDRACLLGLDSTHYLTPSSNGTWVAN